MKLLVLGATGGTGLEIVRQAVERGDSVMAYVRSPERLKSFGDRIAILQGNLLDVTEMTRAIAGQDAVISGFGPRHPLAKGEENLLERFAAVLASAMKRTGVRRVVIESVAFLFSDSILPPAYLIGKLFFRRTVADSSAMEKIIENSGLDWTIVRPPQLTDSPATRKYRVRVGHLPRFGFSLSRADTADFMLKAAHDPATIGKIIGICN